jgi:Protein of unknown function (DUF3995)
MAFAAAVLATVLGALAAMHLYWAVRGVSPTSVALPQVDGHPVFVPSRAATVIVACCLLVASAVAASRVPSLPLARYIPSTRLLPSGFGLVFLARAIGDFCYVGFFKRVRDSRFAVWDKWLFSPLCLLIGLGFVSQALSSSFK